MRKMILCSVWILLSIVLPQSGASQSIEMKAAQLFYKKRNYDKAMEWFQKALSKDPLNAEAHFRLGEIYGMKGCLEDMLWEFDNSLAYSKRYENDIKALLQKYLFDVNTKSQDTVKTVPGIFYEKEDGTKRIFSFDDLVAKDRNLIEDSLIHIKPEKATFKVKLSRKARDFGIGKDMRLVKLISNDHLEKIEIEILPVYNDCSSIYFKSKKTLTPGQYQFCIERHEKPIPKQGEEGVFIFPGSKLIFFGAGFMVIK